MTFIYAKPMKILALTHQILITKNLKIELKMMTQETLNLIAQMKKK